MAVYINTTYTTGATLFATIKRLSDGYRWSVAATAFQAAPTLANSKITLTEGSSEYAGSYSGSVASLGNAAEIVTYIHDDGLAGDTVVGLGQSYATSTQETIPADVLFWKASAPASLSTGLTLPTNVQYWAGTATATDAGLPSVNTTSITADAVNASALADSARDEIRNSITGYAGAMQLDASGYIKVSSGTGTGQISLTSGVASVAVASIGADVITSTALAASAANEIADAVLTRNVSNTEGAAGIHSLTGLVLMSTESSISGTALTITQTDGATPFATRTLTLTPGADPVTGVT
jgi:pectin methylesterase-like acyl-CoA thioesterase